MRRRRLLLVSAGVLLAAGVALYFTLGRPLKPDAPVKPDAVAAAHASARGVGLMEQFRYLDAAEAFAEAEKLAPGWRPAKINRAIALLNTARPAELDQALALFAEVLKDDPADGHAHFCSGIIHYHRNNLDTAHAHFAEVAKLDPADAHARFYMGKTRADDQLNPLAKADYELALKLNPYLNAARYNVAQHFDGRDVDRSEKLLAEFTELIAANWELETGIKYTEFGRYAEVIGASPVAPAAVGPVPLFAAAGPVIAGARPGAASKRYGAGITAFDYDGDGKPDVLLPGPNTVLLHNDGGGKFTPANAGLAGSHVAAAAADFDNDGRPDVVLAGPAGLKLYRNAGNGTFEDVSIAAGFDKIPGPFVGVAWADLDQDGDLDLIAWGGGRLVVFANAGVAPPTAAGAAALPLSVKFLPLAGPPDLLVTGPIAGVILTDLDADKDVDLVVLIDGKPPMTILNDRLLRFHRGDDLPAAAAAEWAGGFVLDANGDDQSDVVLLAVGRKPDVLVSKTDALGTAFATRFAAGITDSPPLQSAHAVDLDLDGRSDVVGVTSDGVPVFLQGDGTGKFTNRPTPFGLLPADLLPASAAAAFDLDGDGPLDLFAFGPAGPRVVRGLSNGNRGLKLVFTGKRDKRDQGQTGKNQRTNADGVGCRVVVHAGALRAGAELTTRAAGASQHRLPLHLGIGRATAAEAVRIRWPDQVVQAELNVAADGVVEIVENNRKPTSCPVIFAWDGSRFGYVTDCLGAGALGESGPDGSLRLPRPEESVKIDPHKLRPLSGKYIFKVAEPMDEALYLDSLALDVIDHPAGVVVYPDERFHTGGPPPTQKLLAFATRTPPVRATDHRGRDVTLNVRDRDRVSVDGFAVGSWLGYAEEHFVELDFGPGAFTPRPPAKTADGWQPAARLFLVLAGWTEYPYPESIYAATQAGIDMLPPTLEQKQPDGTWKKLADLGFPAGLDRVMTCEITGLPAASGVLRIRTNLQVFWDQILLCPLAAPVASRTLPVAKADLAYRGFAQEFRPGGRPPLAYDYDTLETVPVTKWVGRFTRYGDVTPLLAAVDDRHAIAGPGDEITATFDAKDLPPPPEGFVRSFVLRTHGYCKDTAPTTASAGRVAPLPHRGMTTYPYAGEAPPPLAAYDREWNTRPGAGGK